MADLVVCCDGTWNTPDAIDGGLPAPTNVYKLYSALDAEGAVGPITAYYHPGVGTQGSRFKRARHGALGVGIAKNVMSAYRWLARTYRTNDRIWLFGFSRGAFTVRSLSGMIGRCGLLDPAGMSDAELRSAAEQIFDDYRQRKQPRATKSRPLWNAPPDTPAKESTRIFFIGVWDTVGALGVPNDMAFLKIFDNSTKYAFHDTDLSPAVDHARHAIAIDERRQSFTPTLWSDLEPKQDLKQVWFPGVHADVGGGYGRSGLSDGALRWMMREASRLGLAFRAEAREQIAPDARGVLHQSASGLFTRMKSRPREVPDFRAPGNGRYGLHRSAKNRAATPPLSQPSYWLARALDDGRPIQIYARDRWNATGLYLEAGVDYAFQAEGEWLDKTEPSGPAGLSKRPRNSVGAAYLVADAMGALQRRFRRLSGNRGAVFPLTLREPEYPWFALIGMVASGEYFDEAGASITRPLTPEKVSRGRINEYFLIGAAAKFKPQRSGYLYCFANDTWQTYENNQGSVRLTARRITPVQPAPLLTAACTD